MAKIVSRLINNFKLVPKNLFSSGVLQLSNNAASNSSNIIFTYRDDDRRLTEVCKLRYPVITDDDADDDDDLVCFKYLKGRRRLEICSHSHGIVCFSDKEDIFLFNPFTSLFLRLDPPPFLLPPHIIHTLCGEYHPYHFEKGVRFCYDPDSKHFKVVRFVLFSSTNGQSIMAHVYNSATGRWTRTFSTPVQAGDEFYSFNGHVFHNGVCYWITMTPLKQFIESFDMTREVFNPLIPISHASSMIDSLHIWNGSVVLLSYSSYTRERELRIWAMDRDDESGKVSWSKLFTFDSHSILSYPLLFVNSDELLMDTAKGGQEVVSYNTKTQEIKYLPFKANQVSLFENSLMSFEGGTILTGSSFPFLKRF